MTDLHLLHSFVDALWTVLQPPFANSAASFDLHGLHVTYRQGLS